MSVREGAMEIQTYNRNLNLKVQVVIKTIILLLLKKERQPKALYSKECDVSMKDYNITETNMTEI